MATKNCPKCSKQVPVACKKCLCGHIFFLTRRGASSSSTSPAAASKSTASASTSSGANEGIKLEDFGDGDQPRRSGRVQREKTKFYDALQYENQTRKKQMLRRQAKQGSRSEDSVSGAKGNSSEPETEDVATVSKEVKPESGQEPMKRRRGRPPGINGKKSRIAINHKPSRTNSLHKPRQQTTVNNGISHEVNDEDDDIMADITPEKALQYNIILSEINRKLVSSSWKQVSS